MAETGESLIHEDVSGLLEVARISSILPDVDGLGLFNYQLEILLERYWQEIEAETNGTNSTSNSTNSSARRLAEEDIILPRREEGLVFKVQPSVPKTELVVQVLSDGSICRSARFAALHEATSLAAFRCLEYPHTWEAMYVELPPEQLMET